MKKIILFTLVSLFLISLVNASVIESFKDGTFSDELSERYLWVFTDSPSAQTFTLEDDSSIDKVRLFLSGSDDISGIVKVEISRTANGNPTNDIMTTGEFDGGTLKGYNDKWVDIDLNDVNLEKGRYAIILTPSNAVGLNTLLLIPRIDNFQYPYSKGSLYRFDNNDWKYFSYNMHFEVIGNGGGNGESDNKTTIILIAILLIAIFIFIILMLFLKKKKKTKRRKK